IVREIDALGGLMGQVIDRTGIQFRLLNRRKGPAMHSPRAQADKKAYQHEVKYLIESTAGISLIQELVEDLLVESAPAESDLAGSEFAQPLGTPTADPNGDAAPSVPSVSPPRQRVVGVVVRGGACYRATTVVLTTG